MLIPQGSPQTIPYSILDGVIAVELEGMRLEVEYLSDQQLNELFHPESTQGKHSTNPYTYGNYLDPAVGYVRNRFTVFRVTVANLSLSKIQLQPQHCRLTTDRIGEILRPYGIDIGSAEKNLDSYYRALRGASGNEHYRFQTRMAILHSTAYGADETIFRGERYSGFLVFDSLEEEVRDVALHIREFILKFNAFDKPLETRDFEFSFRRELAVQAYEEWGADSLVQATVRTRLVAPSEVSGQVTGDLSRDAATIDAYIRTRLAEVERCFEIEYAAGRTAPGQVVVRFVLLSHGGVEDAEIASSSVGNETVERCILNQVRRWRFRPSGGEVEGAVEDTLAVSRPTMPLSSRVSISFTLEYTSLDANSQTTPSGGGSQK